jgi:hypothetical protein
MSRFHRVDDLEAMPAHRFFEYVTRLPVYGGAVALAARSVVADEEPELRTPSETAFNPTPEDLARMFPAAPGAGQMVPMFEHAVV